MDIDARRVACVPVPTNFWQITKGIHENWLVVPELAAGSRVGCWKLAPRIAAQFAATKQ